MSKKQPQRIKVNGHIYVKADDYDEPPKWFLEGIRQSKQSLQLLSDELSSIAELIQQNPKHLDKPGLMKAADTLMSHLTSKFEMLQELHDAARNHEPGTPFPRTNAEGYFGPGF